jgi:protein-L-isoaspartate(D-aspartate) O-methyltransferase
MDATVLRDDMVDSLAHESKGWLSSESLTVAMRTVPREDFLPDDFEPYADRDYRHLGTRVLSPSTVARLLEALEPEPKDSVLVVGAGVGYTAAVLAELVGPASVHAIDITRRVVYEARSNLESAGYGGVLVDCRDGADGLPEYAPYDRILVEAAAVRPPAALVSQLAPDGRLVMPVGPGTQHLTVVDADGETSEHGACAFEPLLVDGEQADTLERNRTRREDREFAERAARRRKGWELEWIDWDHEGV